MNTPHTDELIRLIKERVQRPEPNALDALAAVASDIVYCFAMAVILLAPVAFWVMTPAGMQ